MIETNFFRIISLYYGKSFDMIQVDIVHWTQTSLGCMLYCNSYLPEPLGSVNTPAQPPYSWITVCNLPFVGVAPKGCTWLMETSWASIWHAEAPTNRSQPMGMMVMGAFGTGRFFVWIVVFFSIFTYTMKLQ